MNLLARCWIISGPHGGPMVVYKEGDANYWREHSKLTVTGPYVLEAEQPEGAVEDARRLGEALRAVLDRHGCECGVCVEAEQAIPSTTTGGQ